MGTACAHPNAVTSRPLPGSLYFDPGHFAPISHVQEEWGFGELDTCQVYKWRHKGEWSVSGRLYFLLHLPMTQVYLCKKCKHHLSLTLKGRGCEQPRPCSPGWQAAKGCASGGWSQAGAGWLDMVTSLWSASAPMCPGIGSHKSPCPR